MSHKTTYNWKGLPSLRPKKKNQNERKMTATLIAVQPDHQPHGFPEEKRPQKYHNIDTMANGIKFRSKKEANRYQELSMAEKAGLISNLEVHPRFHIDLDNWVMPDGTFVGHAHLCDYIADFSYLKNGHRVVEDTKGKDKKTGWDTRTEAYKLKKIMMRIINCIELREV